MLCECGRLSLAIVLSGMTKMRDPASPGRPHRRRSMLLGVGLARRTPAAKMETDGCRLGKHEPSNLPFF